MRLIVGLGNPGKKYECTRHNIGFMCVDMLLKKLNASLDQEGFKSFYTAVFHKGEKIIIMEPQTYMNLSGEAVSAIVNFYKIEHEDILVIYDDLDLPAGKLRLRSSGSSGGHNGMKNIIGLLGDQNIKRIRIGISRDTKYEVCDYVLSKIAGEDKKEFDKALDRASDAVLYWLDERDYNKVMSKFN